jgi:hypothetical protein
VHAVRDRAGDAVRLDFAYSYRSEFFVTFGCSTRSNQIR